MPTTDSSEPPPNQRVATFLYTIRCWDSNSRPLQQESFPITNRPWPNPDLSDWLCKYFNHCLKNMRSLKFVVKIFIGLGPGWVGLEL